jgi:hypothetical protein
VIGFEIVLVAVLKRSKFLGQRLDARQDARHGIRQGGAVGGDAHRRMDVWWSWSRCRAFCFWSSIQSATWTQALQTSLVGLKVTVTQGTSDEARRWVGMSRGI